MLLPEIQVESHVEHSRLLVGVCWLAKWKSCWGQSMKHISLTLSTQGNGNFTIYIIYVSSQFLPFKTLHQNVQPFHDCSDLFRAALGTRYGFGWVTCSMKIKVRPCPQACPRNKHVPSWDSIFSALGWSLASHGDRTEAKHTLCREWGASFHWRFSQIWILPLLLPLSLTHPWDWFIIMKK